MAASIKETSNSAFKGNWAPIDTFGAEGNGLEGEGDITALRFHTVTAKDRVERYIAITLKVTAAFETKMDKYGARVAVDASEYPGHANSLTMDTLAEKMASSMDLIPASYRAKLHPTEPATFEFWALASSNARKFSVGQAIHFNTEGNSLFLNSFFLTSEGNFSHMEGGDVMAQMSKLSDHLSKKTMWEDEVQGCDSDEWSE
eukprot:m.354762 g.354762  ORF g.354762 m.354762 type:complete len:202 (+) comp17095_c0_seq1:127-732(+)